MARKKKTTIITTTPKKVELYVVSDRDIMLGNIQVKWGNPTPISKELASQVKETPFFKKWTIRFVKG